MRLLAHLLVLLSIAALLASCGGSCGSRPLTKAQLDEDLAARAWLAQPSELATGLGIASRLPPDRVHPVLAQHMDEARLLLQTTPSRVLSTDDAARYCGEGRGSIPTKLSPVLIRSVRALSDSAESRQEDLLEARWAEGRLEVTWHGYRTQEPVLSRWPVVVWLESAPQKVVVGPGPVRSDY